MAKIVQYFIADGFDQIRLERLADFNGCSFIPENEEDVLNDILAKFAVLGHSVSMAKQEFFITIEQFPVG
ncbi:hypothetical protein D3C80_730150 [compost metagenome]